MSVPGVVTPDPLSRAQDFKPTCHPACQSAKPVVCWPIQGRDLPRPTSRWAHRSSIAILLLHLVLLAPAESAGAAAQAGKILMEGAKWLGRQIVSYETAKVFDRLLGIDYQTQLQELEKNLLAELRKGTGDADKLRVELAVTRSQLAKVHSLLNAQPTSSQLDQFKRELKEDLAKLAAVQSEQAKAIQGLVRKDEDHEARIRRLEAQSAPGTRGEVRDQSGGHIDRPSPQDAPSRRVEREAQFERQAVQRQRRTRSSGVTLIASVTGHSNAIEVVETDDFGQADTGFFIVEPNNGNYFFRLLAATGGVVTVYGDHNTIYLPRTLCGRLRVVNRGKNNRIAGCK